MPDAPTERPQSGELAAAISNLTVQLQSEYTGRGPTRARTHISGQLVAVVVQDAMTRGELSLIRDGEEDRALDTRQAFQRAMREELAGGVEQITGRQVAAFVSANHTVGQCLGQSDATVADSAGPASKRERDLRVRGAEDRLTVRTRARSEVCG